MIGAIDYIDDIVPFIQNCTVCNKQPDSQCTNADCPHKVVKEEEEKKS